MAERISELAIPGLAPPEPTVAPDNPGNPQGNKWIDVVVKPEYIKLSNDEKAKAKEQYFNEMVAPNVPPEVLDSTRTEFSNYTKRIEIKHDEPSFIESAAKGLLKGTSRVAGVALGALNSPLAFVWGSANEQNIDPEEFKKLPTWKQALSATAGGIKSAYKSATEEGSWGTMYGDYYKGTRGVSIEESLPENLKWTAPTIEVLAALISDPLASLGTAKQLARSAMEPGALAMSKIKFPQRVLAELEKFDQLQAGEKKELQTRLMDILKNRNEYHAWWENTVKENPAMVKEPQAVGGPLLKPGERAVPEVRGIIPTADDIATKVAPSENKFGLKAQPPAKELAKKGDVTAAQFISKVRQEKGIESIKPPNTIESIPIETSSDKSLIGWNTLNENRRERLIRMAGWEAPDGDLNATGQKLLKTAWDDLTFTQQTDLAKVGSKGYGTMQDTRPASTPISTAESSVLKYIPKPASALEFANRIRESSGLPPLDRGPSIAKMGGLKSPMGMAAGIEQDDEGNIQYNVGKGLLGTLAVAGGLGVANIGGGQKFKATLAVNPAWAKVHGMVGEGGGLPQLGAVMSKFGQKAVTVLFDRFSILAKKGMDSAYEQARMYNAYKDQAQLKLGELVEAFKPVKKDEVIVTDYILAHRAENRAARGIKNPNNVTLKDAQQSIKEIEAQYIAQGKDPKVLKDALVSFQKWGHDYILKEALDSGVISQPAYNDIVKNNKWYATFEVLDYLPENMNSVPGNISGEYFSVANQKIIKTMKGTEKQISDPLEATLKKFASAQALYARNRVASALIDDPVFSNVGRPIAKSQKEFAIMTAQGLNPVVEGTKIKGYDTISRFKDGRVEAYLAPTDITEAMKQLSPFQANRAVHAVNAVFRNAATSLYLPFTVSNAFRDGLMAYTTAPVYKALGPQQFMADWVSGFWNGAKQEFGKGSQLSKDYINAGGGFGYVGSLRDAKIAKEMLFQKGGVKIAKDVITSPFKLIEKISSTIELAPRLGTFKRGMMQGLSPEDAALVARQSTIDFNRGGTFTKMTNQFVPFLNARVQSRVTLFEALKNKPGATVAKAFMSTVVPGLGAYAWNRMYYSDLLDDIPEEIRKNYFCIITGTGEDSKGKIAPQYFVIPKGDIGQMAFNPIEFAMDKMWKKDRTSTGRFLVNTLNDLSPVDFAKDGKISASSVAGSVLPPIVKAPIENITNLNFFTGREIVPYYMGKNLPPELQYKKDTPELYRYMGEKMGISPLKIQNMASGVFAAYGREGLSPDAMLRGFTGRVMKTRGGAIEARAWETIKDIENGFVTVRAYAKKAVEEGDRQTASKLIREWNSGLSKQIDAYNAEFGESQFKEKGGIRQSYMFTPEKMKNILMNKKDTREPIQQLLMR